MRPTWLLSTLLLSLPAAAMAPATLDSLPATSSSASCPDKPTALGEAMAAADAAWEATNAAIFDRNAAIAVACFQASTRPVTPELAAGYLRLQGLIAARAKDLAATGLYFRGAVAADPSYALPEDLLPKGNVTRALYEDARRDPVPPGTPLPTQPKVTLYVNGVEADVYPSDRPVWIQTAVAPAGVVENRILQPGEAFELTDNPVVSLALDERERREHVARRFWLTSAGCALVALAVEGAAWRLQQGVYADLQAVGYGDSLEPALAAQARVDALHGLALGAVGMTLGAAGAAVVVRF